MLRAYDGGHNNATFPTNIDPESEIRLSDDLISLLRPAARVEKLRCGWHHLRVNQDNKIKILCGMCWYFGYIRLHLH